MTQKAQQILEEKFAEFKASLNDAEWADEQFLLKKVIEFESADVVLAFRVMQRVKNLNPVEKNIARLKNLQERSFEKIPELVMASSSESKGDRPLVKGAQSFYSNFRPLLANSTLNKFKKPFSIFVLIPFVIFSFYQIVLASPRYESQAKLIVKEPDGIATLDPAMAIMSGFGGSAGNLDVELVKAFIYSMDMLSYIKSELPLEEHYSSSEYDYFSRLEVDASNEKIFSYFESRVLVEIDEKSQIISLFVQGFTPEFSHDLSKVIVERAEWFINEVGHKLAKKQLQFVQQEHALVEEKLQQAKTNLLAFQRRHNLLDPQAEGTAFQQITYQLEGLIATKRTELRTLLSSMSESAPQVVSTQAEIYSLTQQLENERARFTRQPSNNQEEHEDGSLSISEVMAKFSDYQIDLELALQAYSSSQVSLEKSRIESYRQLKYLVVVESSTLPEDASYPEVLYNITLYLALSLMLFGIGKIILATIDELR